MTFQSQPEQDSWSHSRGCDVPKGSQFMSLWNELNHVPNACHASRLQYSLNASSECSHVPRVSRCWLLLALLVDFLALVRDHPADSERQLDWSIFCKFGEEVIHIQDVLHSAQESKTVLSSHFPRIHPREGDQTYAPTIPLRYSLLHVVHHLVRDALYQSIFRSSH
ncbi:hypothetical protein OH77DRAFT_1430286 [Trametes cingulata]|nr:hypothetical protein OH77DRAFT_1430286 [Trametes cingulata]